MKPYNIHISCCVIALTNVIVFIIVLTNWHFIDPNLDSEPPGIHQINLNILKLVSYVLVYSKLKF